MNPGNTTLDLSAKDKLNVTWHLGYPHKGENRNQIAYRDKSYYHIKSNFWKVFILFTSFCSGGFKLQLLDSKGRHVQDLTPPGEFVGDPLTRQTVKLFREL